MNSNSSHPDVPTHVTVEIMGMPVKLRDDLVISLHVYQGETCYVIEDPLSSRFYRLGLAEYTLVSLLDGQTTIADAMGKTAVIMGAGALTEQDAAALCNWIGHHTTVCGWRSPTRSRRACLTAEKIRATESDIPKNALVQSRSLGGAADSLPRLDVQRAGSSPLAPHGDLRRQLFWGTLGQFQRPNIYDLSPRQLDMAARLVAPVKTDSRIGTRLGVQTLWRHGARSWHLVHLARAVAVRGRHLDMAF